MTTAVHVPMTEAADRALTLLGGDWDSPTGRLLLAIEVEAAALARALPVHPYTCGTCPWEGPSRVAYYRHCLSARHDHWRNIIELHVDAGRRRRLRALVDRRMLKELATHG